MIEKSARAVSVIGGADGPTSIFIAGKTKKLSLKLWIKNRYYQHKRGKVAKKIIPNSHSLQEVIQYIQDAYGAVEVSKESHNYREQYKDLKASLILQHKPELLGELAEIKRPTDCDEKSFRDFFEQAELRSQKAISIPEELFSMDFHVYEIMVPDVGRIEFGIDTKWDIFGDSYSGSKKGMKELEKISKDVHMYYGVTAEDIRDKTKRYSVLLTVLSS